MFHIVAIPCDPKTGVQTGEKVYMTSQALTHEEACVVKSKITEYPFRRLQLEAVPADETAMKMEIGRLKDHLAAEGLHRLEFTAERNRLLEDNVALRIEVERLNTLLQSGC